jgi:hypothetical protein
MPIPGGFWVSLSAGLVARYSRFETLGANFGMQVIAIHRQFLPIGVMPIGIPSDRRFLTHNGELGSA